MLRELRIRNFAIIDDLTISFRPGLNVITGETGAGKTVVLRALALLCGGRASPDIIGREADNASIDGLFDCALSPETSDALGLGADNEVLVHRRIPQSGKGRIQINGSPATASLLTQLGDHLIHIYGQHDQALLLRAASHLELLDRFGNLVAQRDRMARGHAELVGVRKQLEELDRQRDAVLQRRELLEFQCAELAAVNVEADEEAALRSERDVLRNAERLQQACREGESALYSGGAATVAALARQVDELSGLATIAAELAAPTELIETARVQLEEAASQLRSVAERIHSDPVRLEAVEERLDLLTRLSRKHHMASTDLPATLTTFESELASLDAHTAGRASMETTAGALEREALHIANELSAARDAAARHLEERMGDELAKLGMSGTSFRVVQEPVDHERKAQALRASGIDAIEFHLSTNPGDAPKPLARVASGGELSRILLALKALTAAATETPILIFDEVDAGIGGTVADAVARRLKALAGNRQLLCITHLPQIAAYADHHFAVEKRRERGRSVAHARILAPAERVQELSRMLGGTVAPAEAEQYARRLIAESQPARN